MIDSPVGNSSMIKFICLLLCISSLYAQKSIVFVSNETDIENSDIQESGVFVSNVPFLEEHPLFLSDVESQLPNVSQQDLENFVTAFYVSHDRPLILVKMTTRDETLFVLVRESTLEDVVIRGNRFFKTSQIRKMLREKPDETIQLKKLESDIAWINKNPFMQADGILSPGKTEGTTLVELAVQDRWPYRFYAGADNTGTNTTGLYRQFTGINFGNLFGLGHRGSYQFTFSSQFSRFHSQTGEYIIPLPWHHTLRLYGSYAKVKPDLHNDLLSMTGKSWQVDLRYEIPLNPVQSTWLQQFTFGLDYKRTNNNLLFNGDEVLNRYVDIAQAMLQYLLGTQTRNFRNSLDVELFLSPGHITPSNTTQAFEKLRAYAHACYGYLRAAWNGGYQMKPQGFAIELDLWGQGSTTNLLPSEQLDMGGYDSIRGYEQSEVTVDNGLVGSLELHSPSIIPLTQRSKLQHTLYFLLFLDGGWGRNHKLVSGEKTNIPLAGTGVGVRYALSTHLLARLDYAVPLINPPYSPKEKQRWYFGMNASY